MGEGPLIIPSEARSKFPDFGHLVSGHILPIFRPLMSGWVILDGFFREFWCPDQCSGLNLAPNLRQKHRIMSKISPGHLWCPDGDQTFGFLKANLSGW